MSAPVTEAHRKLVAAIIRDLSIDDGAQLIADSEAKAVEQANAQVESLLSAAKNAIPASEHPAEPTVENWAWQMRNLGEDRRLVYADRDKLRAEVEHLRESEKAFCEDRNTQRTRAERAEAELDGIRALADRRNKRYHVEDTTHQLVAALDQALDIAQAELAAERARLDAMAAELANCAGYIASVRTDRLITWHEELYALQTLEWAEGAFEIAEKANAVLEAHDAAMKEGAK